MRKFSRPLSIVLTMAIAVSMTCSATFADVKSEKGKLGALNKKKQEVEQENKELTASKEAAQKFIQKVDGQLTTLATSMYKTKKELDQTQKKIDKTKKKLKKAKKNIAVQYDEMKLRIKYMYENGDTQMLDLLLNSGSFTEFLNKAEYITELSQYDRKMLDKLKKTKTEIATAKATLVKEGKKLVAIQKQQKEEKDKLEVLSESKKEELEAYKTALASNEASADAIELEIQAQEKRIATAEKESQEAAKRAELASQQAANSADQDDDDNEGVKQLPTTTKTPGTTAPSHASTVAGFTWPCPGHSVISSDYGVRTDPFSGASSFHAGIDIPAPQGTPVVASASGKVEWATYSATAGNWIGISHGNGVVTVYMHMSALLVSAGQIVHSGQRIGLVGTTGSSTGNHLHFSVRVNGAYVSPWNYVGH